LRVPEGPAKPDGATGASDASLLALHPKSDAYAEIERRYECAHTTREIRQRTIADGRTTFVSQCVECGHTSSPIKRTIALAQATTVPPYDEFAQARRRAAKHQEYSDLVPVLRAEYEEYLRSEAWGRKRDAALARANGKCELCGVHAEAVHHLSYERIGSEQPQDLLAVCNGCHDDLHNRPHRTVIATT
jgi:5-methylcytosine-specific restriction endonuclease McrA